MHAVGNGSSTMLDVLRSVSQPCLRTFRSMPHIAPLVPSHGDSHRGEQYSQDATYRNARTRGPFKPRNANRGTSSYQLRQFAEATLGSGSLRKAVKLPEGEDLNEWLAVNGKSRPFHVGFGRTKLLMSTCMDSCGLLQSNQSPLWLHHRILFPPVVSGNEGHR